MSEEFGAIERVSHHFIEYLYFRLWAEYLIPWALFIVTLFVILGVTLLIIAIARRLARLDSKKPKKKDAAA